MTPETKILVVDDDPDLREVLRIILEDAGYRVTLAESGPRGVEMVHQERPDLLLLDVMMPEGTEGFHVVWKLRNLPDPHLRDLPEELQKNHPTDKAADVGPPCNTAHLSM